MADGAVIPVLQTWQLRALVGAAALALVAAQILVRFVHFASWRGSLGRLSHRGTLAEPAQPLAGVSDPSRKSSIIKASCLARSVERATALLPGHYKCLPKAVALQWLLQFARMPSSLVIAFHISDRAGPDAYHAWVEVDGTILIGQCDRQAYRPVMVLDQPRNIGGAA